MADPNTTLTDYERGYRDGVVAASVEIAEHYKALEKRGREVEADIAMSNKMLQDVVLAELAPLQDRINRLHAPEAESDA